MKRGISWAYFLYATLFSEFRQIRNFLMTFRKSVRFSWYSFLGNLYWWTYSKKIGQLCVLGLQRSSDRNFQKFPS